MDLYDGGLAYADSTVGDIVGKLDELGLLDKTIVMIGSDHGELLGEDGRTISHPPRASHDDLLHVPLVMAGPGLPIEPTPEQSQRASQIMEDVVLPLWREKDALRRETPPYFRVNHPIPFNREKLTDVLDPQDNLWARVPSRWSDEWHRDDLLVSSPWSESAPGLILVAKVPNGTYDVSVYCTTLDDQEPSRGSSFSFLVARVENEFRLFELPAASPGETNEAWLDVGTYTVSDGKFRYWVEHGNRHDNAVVGSLRFVQTGTEIEPPGPDEVESDAERFRALGYLN